ncbi:ATP-dependent DNA helicase Rep, partial [Coemansia erecta]
MAIAGKKTGSLKRKPAAASTQTATQAKAEDGDHAAAGTDSSLKQLRMDDYVVSFTHSMDDGDSHGSGSSSSTTTSIKPAASQKALGGFQSARSMIKSAPAAAPADVSAASVISVDDDDGGLSDGSGTAMSDDAAGQGEPAIRLDETQERISKMDINRPLLIVAGAGSGKTTTLCARVIEMMRQGVRPEQILVITFTNKAADELKERIGRYTRAAGLPTAAGAGRMPHASTFHAWCYALVAQHYGQLGWDRMPMVAAAESEHLAVVAAAMRDLESCRRLRQCELMLGLAADDAGAGDPA